MNWRRIKAIARKDIREITASRLVVLPMVLVPLLLSVVVPSLILVLALTLDIGFVSGFELIERILPFYSIPEDLTETMEKMIYVFLNYTFLPLFMLLPVMASTIVTANSIVGEKERKTLETLLHTPVTNRELIVAKLSAGFIPAMAVTVIGFIGYFVATNAIFLALRGTMIVRAWIWLPAILLMAPSVALLGLSITLLVSQKAKTYTEAQQVAGVVVLPFVALIVVQMAGLVTFNVLYLVLFSLVLAAIGGLILMRRASSFTREGIISTL